MEGPVFSVITVCLNAGEKLKSTVASVLKQDFTDYEIIVKDGGSGDGCLKKLPTDGRIRVFCEKDTGIYEAMNQALAHVSGDYVLFLNCGDSLPEKDILRKTADFIRQHPGRGIYYGDTFCERTRSTVASPRRITPFVCYRNIPCHQSCFYAKELFDRKTYDLSYRIRADYDHFLWCVMARGVKPVYMGFVTAAYEGGGYSESRENRKRDGQEHRKIARVYLGKGRVLGCQLVMAATLAPLRRFLAENPRFSGFYQKVKSRLYGNKG